MNATRIKVKNKPKLIVILGQTSTGKSDAAVSLAKILRISGLESEIISADSRQIYLGLDLLSGKITEEEMCGIPHHLLDIMSPKKTFSVAQFQKRATKIIRDISKRGKIPILVGGTGLYIDSVVYGTVLPKVPPNLALRKKLEGQMVEVLFKELEKKDPARALTIDPHNKVRIIRALEIIEVLGIVPQPLKNSPYNVLTIGLTISDDELKKRIHTRLVKRIQQGMIEEAQKLHTQGLSWKRMYELGLECRYCALYLQEKISKKEMFEQLETAIWQYAKRQKTWFKRDKSIIWIHPKELVKINLLAKKFLS